MFNRVKFISIPLTRHIYRKPQRNVLLWLKKDVDALVYKTLFEYANVDDSKVTFTANMERDLLVSKREKFGFTLDLAELFQIPLCPDTMDSLDLKSGREAADWVAFNLEEDERLVDHKSK